MIALQATVSAPHATVSAPHATVSALHATVDDALRTVLELDGGSIPAQPTH